MKNILFIFLSICIIFFPSCTLSKQESEYNNDFLINNSILVPGKINVTINQADDKELKTELFQILSVKLNSFNKTKEHNDNILSVNISIIERTSIENFETVYSDFIYCCITDSTDNTVYENYQKSASKHSVTSVNKVNKYISTLINELNKIQMGKIQ